LLVVNPNLCFDRTLRVDAFEAGTVSRPSQVQVAAGGKGVNVLRTVRDLGGSGGLVGFVAEEDGARLLALLDAEGIHTVPVPVAGGVRSATIILEDSGRATVLNEPGPVLAEADLTRLRHVVDEQLAAYGGPLVCSGSLPPGLPVEAYGALTETAHAHGVPAIVDAARDALVATLPYGPDLVSPNLAEAEGIVSGVVTEQVHAEEMDLEEVRKRAVDAADGLLERGARHAVVTAGAHGAWAAGPGLDVWVDAPTVTVANPIGAGDSFAGGVAVALVRGLDWREAVAHGIAVASAAVETVAAGRVDRARAEQLAAAVAAGVPR
jgi:1-phosphofructokinase family hexose kinase